MTESTLTEGLKTAYRWNGTSTTILKYNVPKTTGYSSTTDRWSIKIEPEDNFEQFETYVSFDSKFNLIEEKQEALVLNDALIVYQTSSSSGWCTGCSIWLIINTAGDRRVYVTA